MISTQCRLQAAVKTLPVNLEDSDCSHSGVPGLPHLPPKPISTKVSRSSHAAMALDWPKELVGSLIGQTYVYIHLTLTSSFRGNRATVLEWLDLFRLRKQDLAVSNLQTANTYEHILRWSERNRFRLISEFFFLPVWTAKCDHKWLTTISWHAVWTSAKSAGWSVT